MKLNLDKQFTSLDGKPFEGDASHMGKTLAHALSMSNKGNSIMLYNWALELWNKRELDLGGTDYDVLLAWLETSELLNNLVKAQLINELKSQK